MYISVHTQDNMIRSIVAAIAYYIMLLAFYIDIGQDMSMDYALPVCVPMIGGLFLLQYATRVPLFFAFNLPNFITGLGWASAFPLLYAWTYNTPWYISKICFDFIIGTGLFALLTLLESLCVRTGKVKLTAALFTALNFVGLIVPFIQYAYYVMVWHCLSPASLMALYLTNWRESIDFLQANVGYFWLAVIVAVICLLLNRAYVAHVRLGNYMLTHCPDTLRSITQVFLTVLAAFTVFYWYLPQSSVAALLHDVTSYVEQTQEYGKYQVERLSSLDIEPTNALPALTDTPHTVIMVIGESASRDYMQIFTPQFPYADTPWLSQAVQDNTNFLLFTNCYASWSQTVPTLERALTEESQYNDKEFLSSVSLIDVARQAGYKTWWFSNQGRYGEFDSVITMIAKTADKAEWTDDAYNFSGKYDEVLLDYLRQVDLAQNNFIVLHIMGSHIYYNNRYPREFERWKTADGTGMATSSAAYANSILYTDYVLSQIFAYAQENLNLAALMYFSDHGENLAISHNPDVFSFDMVRIPMFMYLSASYQKNLPERFNTLRQHRQTYFTNDMLYDTVCGIINAPSSRYEAAQDLSSSAYAFNRDNLTTMLGQRKLTEDTNAPLSAASSGSVPAPASPAQP